MIESVLREQRVLDWVGGFPERWETHSLGSQMYPVSQKNLGLKVKTVLSLSYGRVIVKPIEKLRGLVPESFETYQILEPGDIVIRPTDLQNDKTSLRVGLVKNHGIITSAYISIRTRESLDKRYAALLLGAYDFMKVFYGFGSGLRQNLDFRHLKHIPIPVPAKDEQEFIVRYLDHAELRIAKAIQAKQKMVALLNEQKQVIISELVTRGLNPNVPMKDSGQAWLGQIPAHWDLHRMKSQFDELANKGRPDLPLLAATQSMGVVTKESYGLRTVTATRGLENLKIVEPGDFVISLRSFQGGLEISYANGIISPAYTILRAKEDANNKFFSFLFKSKPFLSAIQLTITGIREGQNVDYRRLGLTMIPIPPRDEQIEINNAIVDRTEAIDRAKNALLHEIELLKEYRNALISDVVTGKKDVRAEAADLPDVDPAELAHVLSDALIGNEEEDEVDGASEIE